MSATLLRLQQTMHHNHVGLSFKTIIDYIEVCSFNITKCEKRYEYFCMNVPKTTQCRCTNKLESQTLFLSIYNVFGVNF